MRFYAPGAATTIVTLGLLVSGILPAVAADPSAAPPAPVCANGPVPDWVTSAHNPKDGIPDPAGRIVFGKYIRTGVNDQFVSLYAVDPDGSDLVRLLDCEAVRPRISPDGHRVAFSLNMDDGSIQVATLAMDGTDLRVLTDTAGYADIPDWSPDGSWLIYAHAPMHCPDADCHIPGGFHMSLWRMDADGSNQRLIGDPAREAAGSGVPEITQDAEPRLSPDGTQVVFNRIDSPDYTYRLMIRDLATGVERMATGSDRGEEHPEWSPDGRWIIYNTYDESKPGSVLEQIERLPSDDATAVPAVLYPGGGAVRGFKPTYSPDGSSIAFICGLNLCTMDADGSNVQVIVRGAEFNHVTWGVVPAGGQ